MVAAVNPPAALQRLGLSLGSVQSMMWQHQVQARAAAPEQAPRVYRRARLVNTQYLDGEQQRAKKAMLLANEAVIVGMILQGVPYVEIALAFGVTDMAIRNREKMFGVKSRPAASAVGDSRNAERDRLIEEQPSFVAT